MALDELFIPTAPANIPHRPLNKGMILNAPSNMLPEGAVLRAKNMIVGEAGPLRRPGTSQFAGGASVYFPPVRNLILLTLTSGTQQIIVVDRRIMYTVTSGTLTSKTWDYDSGLVNLSTALLTVSGLSLTNWTNANLKAGDILVVGSTGEGNLERLVVRSIDDTNLLQIDTLASYAHTNTEYDIWRAFGASNPYLVSWAVASNKVIFADSSRPPYAYDGSTFGALDASLDFKPTCVEFFKDRLWFGRIQEGSNDHRQRIIWSTVTDITDLDPTGRYLDLPYQQGAVQRLVGLGEFLIAYFEDAIYFGRETNISGDTLPVAFERLETGGIGLVGMAAITPFLDGHFFIGQDDIYFLSPSGFQRIGTPIVKESIETCENLWAAYATVDAARSRIIFGFPSEGEEMTRLWSFDYKAKAWSYDEINCTAITGLSSKEVVTWDSLSGTWDDPDYDTWDSAQTGASKKFFIGQDGKVFIFSEGTTDADTVPISAEIITPDFDDRLPDTKKTTTRLSVKIDRVLSSNLVFAVSWSTDRGRTWNSAGNLTISAGDDEGYVNFLATGSTVRFRLVSTSQVNSYRIMELVRRSRGRGLEVHLGPSD